MHTTAKKTPAQEADYAKNSYTDAQREQGRGLFEKTCGNCHDLPVPGAFTISQWDEILPKMFKQSKMSYDDAGLVKAYVVFNAKKP